MSSSYEDKDLQKLEYEIRERAYQVLLESLHEQHPSLRVFAAWLDVIKFMRRGSLREQVKDMVLLPIVQAQALDHDPRWRAVLLVIFWPALRGMGRRKRHWDLDAEHLWANIYWSFMQAVSRLNPAKRSERIGQKVLNDTLHRLHDEYQRRWRRARLHVAADNETLDAMVKIRGSRSLDIGLADEQEARIAHFQKYFDAGQIDETDLLLLVGRHVYGRSIADGARDTGLSYQAAKKRAQRAIKTIGGIPPT